MPQLTMRRLKDSVKARLPATVQQWLELKANIRDVRRGKRLVPEQALEARFLNAIEFLESRNVSAWDYLEFGVYNGSSLACMSRVLRRSGVNSVRMFGFDSFEGLPAEAVDDDEGHWRPGQFKMDLNFTLDFLRKANVDMKRVTLVKGWFKDTLTSDFIRTHGLTRAGVVMVDCDIYSSSKTSLAFAVQLFGADTVVFFDDWHSGGLADRDLGQKKAFEEFLLEHPDLRSEEFPDYGGNSKAFVLSWLS